jgi:hypothetical protein
MSRGFRWYLLTVVLVVVSLLLYGRFGPVPPGRAEAMRVLAATAPEAPGTNAAEIAWVWGRAVPAPERPRAAQERRVAEERRVALREGGDDEAAEAVPDPLVRYAMLPELKKLARLCKHPGRCLEHVREDPDGTAAALQHHAAKLALAREMVAADVLRMDWLEVDGVPTVAPARDLLATSYALRFVRGEQVEAMADVCRDISGWRRLGAGTDHVVASAVAAELVGEGLGYLAEMLAERPAGEPLPADCTTALAPMTDAEFSICEPVRTEFRRLRGTLSRPAPTNASFRHDNAWLIDTDQALAASAPRHARFCGTEAIARARADQPAAPPDDAVCGFFERVAHGPGCVVAQVGTYLDDESLRQYQRTNQAAALALMRTFVWLRAQSPDPRQWKRLHAPASLGLRRELSVGRKELSIGRLPDASGDERYGLPLPAVDAPAATP